MNRRGFLAMISGAVLDPERLLWVPGRKFISIPPPSAGLCVRILKGFEEWTGRDKYYISIANTKLHFGQPGLDDFITCQDNLSVASADEIISRVLRDPRLADEARPFIHLIRDSKEPHSMTSLNWYARGGKHMLLAALRES